MKTITVERLEEIIDDHFDRISAEPCDTDKAWFKLSRTELACAIHKEYNAQSNHKVRNVSRDIRPLHTTQKHKNKKVL